jgi:intergrase/recombinase
MKSLAALAKYTGCYDSWQEIRQRFQLKWSSSDPVQQFSLIFNSGKDLNHMLCWLKDTCSKLPDQHANFLIFNTLTGLRPSEACMAVNLIHKNYNNYSNQTMHTLEHFKFPYFIRRTKKAYISIYNDRIINIAKNTHADISYSFLKYIFRKRSLHLETSFCRKIFATYLKTQGIEQEIIDLLQGRAPKSVFARHYYRPNFTEEREKVIACHENMYHVIR